MKNILITGASSGVGEALATKYLQEGYFVYSISKSKLNINNKNLKFLHCDLSDLNVVKSYCLKFLHNIGEIEFVILNAGMIGKIDDMKNISTEALFEIFNVNVWSSKEIIDTLLSLDISVKQIIAISSGAANNSSIGMGGYGISKTTLNKLIDIYSKEVTNIHFSAISPGLIDTKMLHNLLKIATKKNYTSILKFKDENIQTAESIADRLYDVFPKLANSYKSGSFIHIKDVK
jgi:NADP-dependent 3-hydroxy acid dehydrogenase YdfG